MTAICVPWRSAPKRVPLLAKVAAWYEPLPCPVFYADSDGAEFSRAQAINRAVSDASAAGHSVFVVNDADTLPSLGSLAHAVDATRRDGKSRLPYDECVLMDRVQTDEYLSSGQLPRAPVHDGSCGGVQVFRLDTWLALGGYDERYTGWGHEDSDIGVRAQFERVPGRIWSLWHEPDDRSVSSPRNLKIFNDTHH